MDSRAAVTASEAAVACAGSPAAVADVVSAVVASADTAAAVDRAVAAEAAAKPANFSRRRSRVLSPKRPAMTAKPGARA